MKHGDVMTYEDVGEKFYLLYDETDTNHCILIGEYRTLKETAKAAKAYKEKECPEAVVQAYEMVKED